VELRSFYPSPELIKIKETTQEDMGGTCSTTGKAENRLKNLDLEN
jgi:hypothetical protein